MMIVQFLMDTERQVTIPGCEAPRTEFGSVSEPVALALEQERRVTDQIKAIAAAARAEGEFQGEQFLHWFLKEQVEEVASMSALLRTCEHASQNPLLIEDYLTREARGEAADPSAPAAAGGAV
jgi:ferritin